jgi:ABC-type microcin C transport system permease subunit YejB
LIFIGGIFLLDNLGLMDADRVVAHGWPLILIALGLYQVLKNKR